MEKVLKLERLGLRTSFLLSRQKRVNELLQRSFESTIEECKMKVMEKNVMRLVAVQHLRAAYGIKIKNWNKNKAASCKSTTSTSVSLKKTN